MKTVVVVHNKLKVHAYEKFTDNTTTFVEGINLFTNTLSARGTTLFSNADDWKIFEKKQEQTTNEIVSTLWMF